MGEGCIDGVVVGKVVVIGVDVGVVFVVLGVFVKGGGVFIDVYSVLVCISDVCMIFLLKMVLDFDLLGVFIEIFKLVEVMKGFIDLFFSSV